MAVEETGYSRRSRSWLQTLSCKILQAGKIPRHIAIIMDGNRRFARKVNQEKSFGHALGFSKLTETLEWCSDLGVTEVTVYAFSIENFKRTKEEVDDLMELAKKKVASLMENSDMIERHGVRIRVLGNLELLPRDVLESFAKVVNFTKKHNKVFLNVCVSYTSQHEMAESVKQMAEGAADGDILPGDISEELLERCLYTEDSPMPDLVIRTSGETRLSDFLLWQSSYSCLCFQEVLWPEYSFWNLFSAILTYQRNYEAIQLAREEKLEERKRRQLESDKKRALEQLSKDSKQFSNYSQSKIMESIAAYSAERRRRVEKFVERVMHKRRTFLEQYA